MIFSVVYLLARRLLGCLMVLARREVSKDAEVLLLQHENEVLRRQIGASRMEAQLTTRGRVLDLEPKSCVSHAWPGAAVRWLRALR